MPTAPVLALCPACGYPSLRWLRVVEEWRCCAMDCGWQGALPAPAGEA